MRERYEGALQQNETVDIYQDDFVSLAAEEATLGNRADAEMREFVSFSHLVYCAGKMLPTIEWQPGVKGVVAVSCAQNADFELRTTEAGKVQTGYVLLWSFSDPIHPQYVLEAPGDVFAFRFHPTQPDTVVGGLSSGQVVVWNLAEAKQQWREARRRPPSNSPPPSPLAPPPRPYTPHLPLPLPFPPQARALVDESELEGASNTITAKPVSLSAVDLSHKRTVSDLVWLPPTLEVNEKGRISRKEADAKQPTQQFCTLAADGQLLFWDLRKSAEAAAEAAATSGDGGGGGRDDKNKKAEGWGPTYKQPLLHPSANPPELAARHLALDVPPTPEWEGEGAPPPPPPPRIYTVTEEGEFVSCDIGMPSTSHDTHPRGVRGVILGHYGPCTALLGSPFAQDIFLSVGDWTFNLWRKGVDSPLFVSPFASCMLSCGAWSPLRPGVLFIGRADGAIDVWDLLDRSHEPSMSVTIGGTAVTSMQFQGNGQLLAVGDDQGTVHVMEVPRNLRRAANNEKAITLAFFEREVKRVEYAVQRFAERTAEAAAETAVDGAAEPAADAATGATAKGAGGDAFSDEKLEALFRSMEAKFKAEMGLVDAEGEGEAAEGGY